MKTNHYLIAAVSILTSYMVLLKFSAANSMTWPSIDIVPILTNMLDHNKLNQDFFTLSSHKNNPRMPFILIAYALAKISDIPTSLRIIHLFNIITIPCFMIAFILYLCKLKLGKIPVFTYAITPYAIYKLATYPFHLKIYELVGIWPPFATAPQPYILTISLLLASACLYINNHKASSSLLIFLGTLVHPAMSIFAVIFIIVCLFDSFSLAKNKNLFLWIIVPLILSNIVVLVLFGVEKGISAKEFIYIYIHYRHPHHYDIANNIKNYYKEIIYITAILISFTIVFAATHNKYWKNCLISIIVYLGAIFSQWFFVEIIPVKIIAALGPSRAAILGYWFIMTFGIIILSFIQNKFIHKEFKLNSKLLLLVPTILLTISSISFVKNNKDYEINEKYQEITDYVKINTNSEDVFIVPHELTETFLVGANKNLFTSTFFPFSEDAMIEWYKRCRSVHGDKSPLDSAFYNSLSEENIKKISKQYKADWFIIESQYAETFSKTQPEHEASGYSLYKINDL